MERARKFLMVPFTCMRQNQARRQLTSCGEVMERQRERLDAHADTVGQYTDSLNFIYASF
jgi:hypothetical protein